MTNKNSTDRVGHLGLYIWFTSVKISGIKLWRHDWYWKGKILTEVENIKILAGVASPSLKPWHRRRSSETPIHKNPKQTEQIEPMRNTVVYTVFDSKKQLQ